MILQQQISIIKGNSIELVQFRVMTDEVLPTHLEKAPGSAVYTRRPYKTK